MQLSGGERQRVAIARAVVAGPTLLLCDEPTGNLDSRSSDVVMNELDRLHGDGLTIVVVTHNPLIAERADRRLEMRDGILTAAATDPTAAVDRD
jgi:putative ABC transport system ATP-binding protein